MQQYRQLWEIIVATTTANVGGIARLVAGRPGPWESSHVHDFATSAGA